MRILVFALVWLLVSAADAASQQDSAEVTRLFDGSLLAADRSDLPLAIAMTDSLLQLDSTVLSAYWNVGVWHSLRGEHSEALNAWKAFRSRDSTDWQVEAKLVQVYQALGDTVRRDSALAGLFAHRLVTKNPQFLEATTFCREQGSLEGRQVMVFQNFAPEGDRKVFVTFYLLGADGRDTARISLGSYDLTTLTARQVGDIGPNDRIYHLDYYGDRSHATYGFFRAQPTYDELRSMVAAVLRGDRTPLSSSTVSQ